MASIIRGMRALVAIRDENQGDACARIDPTSRMQDRATVANPAELIFVWRIISIPNNMGDGH